MEKPKKIPENIPTEDEDKLSMFGFSKFVNDATSMAIENPATLWRNLSLYPTLEKLQLFIESIVIEILDAKEITTIKINKNK